MVVPEEIAYTAEPQMSTTNSTDSEAERRRLDSPHSNWDCQSWSCLACCNGGNTTGADCVNLLNVCCGGLILALAECFNAFTNCCGSCCSGCGNCCNACCSGDCNCC